MTPPSFENLIRTIVRSEVSAALREHLEPRLEEICDRVEGAAMQASVEPKNRFVSVEKASAMVDVRPATIREWVKRGHLTRYQSGRLMRIKVSELLEFLARKAHEQAVASIDIDAYTDELLGDVLTSQAAPGNGRARKPSRARGHKRRKE